jgi:hypothetical protein
VTVQRLEPQVINKTKTENEHNSECQNKKSNYTKSKNKTKKLNSNKKLTTMIPVLLFLFFLKRLATKGLYFICLITHVYIE